MKINNGIAVKKDEAKGKTISENNVCHQKREKNKKLPFYWKSKRRKNYLRKILVCQFVL